MLHTDMAAALRRAGSEIVVEEEYCDACSGHCINVLVRRRSAAGSTEWAVEVDGPTSFFQDGRTQSGSMPLKRKQLAQLSYGVVGASAVLGVDCAEGRAGEAAVPRGQAEGGVAADAAPHLA